MNEKLIPCPECGNAHPTIFEYNRGDDGPALAEPRKEAGGE